jgi:hypothetical protein
MHSFWDISSDSLEPLMGCLRCNLGCFFKKNLLENILNFFKKNFNISTLKTIQKY